MKYDMRHPRLLSKDEIVPVRAYADPVLATHLDGSRAGVEIVVNRWMSPGLVVLVDAEGNVAFDRYHSADHRLRPKLRAVPDD